MLSRVGHSLRNVPSNQFQALALIPVETSTGLVVAQQLERNECWPTYRQECCKCANLVRQSNMAHLKPPKPKTKAREMNLEEEVRWGARTLNLLKQSRSGELPQAQRVSLPKEQLEQRFGWLDGYETEVLESLIGKGKRMAGFRMNNSLTSHVLAIAASVVNLTAVKVTESLKACRIKHVQDWCRNHLPDSLKAKRIRDLRPTKAEDKQRKPQLVTIPNF